MWTGDRFEINIEYIRHGKTISNEQKKYISDTDESLSRIGISELETLLKNGYYAKAERVFISPLQRTRETAELIFGKLDFTCIDEIREISFGEFEGKAYNELKDNDAYVSWLNSAGSSRIPGGEDRAEFIERQIIGLKKILLEARDLSQISVVCHGGTVMALAEAFTDYGYYDIMISGGEKLDCHICFEIKGENDVSISHFSITNRDNT